MNYKSDRTEKTYIIAEMSANHAGSFERAKEIIRAARDAGADCIKIQTYTPDTLTIDCDNEYFHIGSGTWEGENLYKLYSKAFTPWEWQDELKKEAEKVGIDFLSTPFDKTAVDFLEGIGLEFYKIASFELVDIPLISYVASKKKPIILSTGMGTVEEIQDAVDAIKAQGNNDFALLKCSSAYPAIPDDMNLANIPDMMKRFGARVGLSDHSMGSLAACAAVAMGATIIEKHFCLSRKIENPDSSFSMEPEEFAEMVKNIRQVEKAIGEVQYGPSEQEKDSVVFRRSVFAVKDIKAGEKFTEENIRIIRPGYGSKPKYYNMIIGTAAKNDIQSGTPLEIKDLKKGCILFLTNNENTLDLCDWLREQGEDICCFSGRASAEMLKELCPSFVISFNYNYIIDNSSIELMDGRIINMHISFLPYNRGSSPNFFSFIDNTPKGVTIHNISAGLDKGDILCQKEIFFDETKETFASSYDRLIYEIKALFKENWDLIKNERIAPVKQVGAGTYHSLAEFNEIQKKYPFTWDTVVSDFKKRAGYV